MAAMSKLASQGSGSRAIQARLLWLGFDGTWAGGVRNSHSTVVSELAELISRDDENIFLISIDGVGSGISLTDRFLGGLSGWGTLSNVIIALRNLARSYTSNNDRIIMVGYSRGAWAARYLAKLIEVVGLPKNGDARLYKLLYKACSKNSMITHEVTQKLLQGYECWTDVKIDALCCFDTVGSLGVPLTGLAKPLALLRTRKGNSVDVVSDVASNVRYPFHCLSLHETREPYSPTLMSGPRVHQVSFPGGHGDMGWMNEKEGLVHAPLAWMIQQLHTHLNISFDEARLVERFPSSTPSQLAAGPTDQTPMVSIPIGQNAHGEPTGSSPALAPIVVVTDKVYPWSRGRIRKAHTGLLAIIGKKGRNPGYTSATGEAGASHKVHIGARLRNQLDGSKAVPGYTLMVSMTNQTYWERRRSPSQWSWPRRTSSERDSVASAAAGSSGGDEPKVPNKNPESVSGTRWAKHIEQAEVGALEARLLGLPDTVVTEHCCHRDCVPH